MKTPPLTAEEAARLPDLFAEAFALPPEQQDAYLAQACAGAPGLRVEVESLLGLRSKLPQLLAQPAVGHGLELLGLGAAGDLPVGTALGEYRVLSLLGVGGMGEVYLAEDTVHGRKVALKLIGQGRAEEVRGRHFRHERKVLAALNHPHIARLYGSGTTPDGQAYLVMELVEGERLDRFCEEKGLGLDERLALFRKVCAAVSYAHQNLVVHRDLKPANIRVTPEGEPKLLDFGIAKLLDPEGTTTKLDPTVTMQGVMTPEYASPEQIKGEPITTASDVYSLGVVLYELLCGQRPYAHLKSRRPDELIRAICEQEPPRPSTAVGKTTPTTAASLPEGQTPELLRSPATLRRQLEGDLDNIAAKALRKDPARRYASAAALSEDLRRHGEGLPVTARKDTLRYRAGKFIRRNKTGVAAATLVVLALITGLIVALWQARVARQERDRARLSQKQSERLNQFLQTLLASADPSKMGKDVKVVQVLDTASQTMEQELADEPILLAQAHLTLSNTYAQLLLGKPAEEHARAALGILQNQYPSDDPAIAQAEARLTQALMRQSRFAEMEPLLRHIVMIQRQQTSPEEYTLGQSLGQLGLCLTMLHRPSEAAAVLDEACARLRSSGNEMTPAYLMAVGQTGNLAWFNHDFGKAADCWRQVLDLGRKIDPKSPNFMTTENNLARVLISLGRFSEAEVLLQQLEQDCKSNLGQGNQLYGLFLGNSSLLDFVRGDYPGVIRKQRECLAILTALNFQKGPGLVEGRIALGLALTRTGHAEEGEPLLRLVDGEEKIDHSYFDQTFGNREAALGECLLVEKRYPEAESLLLTGYDDLETRLGPQNRLTMQARQHLHDLYLAWNKPAEAARYEPNTTAQSTPPP